MDALRLIPHVHSVTVLSEGVEQNGIEYNEIQQLLTNKKKISLIGKMDVQSSSPTNPQY